MYIDLTPERTIGQIEDAFNKVFPYLKLAFFSHPHGEYKSSHAHFRIEDHNTLLRQLMRPGAAGLIIFDPRTTVRSLEQHLELDFGLHVQVMRKSGRVWLETTATDHLTLQEQNTRGETAEHPPVAEAEVVDYREQE